MATIVNGIENARGQIQFYPAPHNHDSSYAAINHTHNNYIQTDSITLNGELNNTPSIYAPTSGGKANQIIKANSKGLPEWADIIQGQSNNALLNELNCFLYFKINEEERLIQFVIDDNFMPNKTGDSVIETLGKVSEYKNEVLELQDEITRETANNQVYWKMPGMPEFEKFTNLISDFYKFPDYIFTLADNPEISFIKYVNYIEYMKSFPIGHKGWLFSFVTGERPGQEFINYCPIEFINNIKIDSEGLKQCSIQIYELIKTYGESERKPIYEFGLK